MSEKFGLADFKKTLSNVIRDVKYEIAESDKEMKFHADNIIFCEGKRQAYEFILSIVDEYEYEYEYENENKTI